MLQQPLSHSKLHLSDGLPTAICLAGMDEVHVLDFERESLNSLGVHA